MLLLSHFLLLSFQWSPSWWEKTRHRPAQWALSLRLSNTQTRKKSVWNLRGVGVRLGGSRAVWSRQGQTVARHPEELPLCLCTATGCNLLLRDKTKLTRHFTGDLAALSDCAHSVWLARIWVAGVYKMDWWSLSVMVILNLGCTLTQTIKHLQTGANAQFVNFLTLW